MGKLMMLAGGMVDLGKGREPTVAAFVVLSAGRQSRMFKVKGSLPGVAVVELDSATTLDVKRFQRELELELAPTLDALRVRGETPHITRPAEAFVFELVRKHLRASEGLDID